MTETNQYANPSCRTWTNTTVDEMKAFVGLLMCMGFIKLPRLELYWSSKFPQIKTAGISVII